ncbi:ferredoxin [Streptomyces sp. A012304]|uniref:ferredoxin n=1 Tax=Streptomyces sp. A012304 TaxID=375446 RepID=UPI00223035AB|nr:ferredoxin [Streptomyces sp. A012304]GKQ37969.1 ferredoxin [Streptomyces sp. A012304]
MRIDVDRDRCCGAGMCALQAPAVFDQDEEDGLVVVLLAEPPSALHEAVREAAQHCPSGAVTFVE